MQANRISALKNNVSQKAFKRTPEPLTASSVEIKDFEINSATKLIEKCPTGHEPKYTGISKGQTSAHFPLEVCENCELSGRCQSKKQAKDFVVRINLKVLEPGYDHEAMTASGAAVAGKPAKYAGASKSREQVRSSMSTASGKSGKTSATALLNVGKNSTVSILRKYGIVAGAAVICLIIGLTLLIGGVRRNTNDLSLSASASEPTEESDPALASEASDVPEAEQSTDTQASDQQSEQEDNDNANSAEASSLKDSYPQVLTASTLRSSGEVGDDSSTNDEPADPSTEELETEAAAENEPTESDEPETADPTATGTGSAVNAANTPVQKAAPPAPSEPKDLPYLIYVSKSSYTIAILGKDESGEYSVLLRTYNTAIGRSSAQTRAGSYTITGRERWRDWGGGSTYTPYSTKHSGGLFFHGPVFTSKDPFHMKASSFNEIGTSSTSGCMRTSTAAAMWIYYNCPDGTPVIIANDSKYTSAPQVKVDASQNFDPTDPDAVEVPKITFTLNYSMVEIHMGDSLNIEVSSFTPTDAELGKLAFSSGDDSIATVDQNGHVTAVGPGTVIITVTADGISETAQSCSVTVLVPVASATPVIPGTPTTSETPGTPATSTTSEIPGTPGTPGTTLTTSADLTDLADLVDDPSPGNDENDE